MHSRVMLFIDYITSRMDFYGQMPQCDFVCGKYSWKIS